MCQPELKLPSVEIWAIRSRTALVSAATVVVVAAIAIPAPIAPPTTSATSTAHFFECSIPTAPPLRVDRPDSYGVLFTLQAPDDPNMNVSWPAKQAGFRS